MKNRDFDEKRVTYRGEIVCEKWDKVKTKFGDGNIERFWLIKKVKVANKDCIIEELLGYRCFLQRKIYGDVCIKPEDAIMSAERVYEHNLEKMAKILVE